MKDPLDMTDAEIDAELEAAGVTKQMRKDAATRLMAELSASVACGQAWCALVGKCRCDSPELEGRPSRASASRPNRNDVEV